MSVAQQVLVGKKRTAAGQRDKLVTIQQMTLSTSTGFPVETWTTLRTAWMGRLDVRADERFTSNQHSSAMETNWYCDFASDMDPDTVDVSKVRRLLFKGRTYDILSAVSLDGRSIELITLAKVDE